MADVKSLVKALKDMAVTQYGKGAPYRNALASALKGDMGGLQELNKPSPVMPNEALDVAMTFAPMGITKAVGSKSPLTEKEFYKLFVAQHKDIKSADDLMRQKTQESILTSGFNKGFNVNALPVDVGGKPSNIIEKRFGNKAGDTVYLLPQEGIINTPNGYIVKEKYTPSKEQIIKIMEDREPSYSAYLRNFK